MRKSTKIAVFLIMLHAGAGMLAASGVAADMGVYPEPGGEKAVSNAQSAGENVDVEGGFGATLFTAIASVATSVLDIVRLVFALEAMLINLGVPIYFVAFVAAPVPIIFGLDIAYMISGRSM